MFFSIRQKNWTGRGGSRGAYSDITFAGQGEKKKNSLRSRRGGVGGGGRVASIQRRKFVTSLPGKKGRPDCSRLTGGGRKGPRLLLQLRRGKTSVQPGQKKIFDRMGGGGGEDTGGDTRTKSLIYPSRDKKERGPRKEKKEVLALIGNVLRD